MPFLAIFSFALPLCTPRPDSIRSSFPVLPDEESRYYACLLTHPTNLNATRCTYWCSAPHARRAFPEAHQNRTQADRVRHVFPLILFHETRRTWMVVVTTSFSLMRPTRLTRCGWAVALTFALCCEDALSRI
ncbi:hypothetical protein B0H16DRAFT_1569335 [Mycena metata]|uniref:Secreted protein n=1 Tax=Mycena metata TaxID=1033252 RepID=A0AAD7MZ86_9AGAR|nr:hypothetical protein B0H16DRAFT_1569335 [Mycena metata]